MFCLQIYIYLCRNISIKYIFSQTIQLRLTVAELNGDHSTNPKAYSIGHIIIGSTSTGKALAHWRQMLAALRRPVAMWHPLRK